MNLNNKGFTLVEVLAVVVIMSILVAIMVPSVNNLIDKNKETNYQSLKDGIIHATKVYLSDNRYDIKIEKSCSSDTEEINVTHIKDEVLTDSKLPIKWLVDNKDLSTNSNGDITNPKNSEEVLDLTNSYVLIKYQCRNKDYKYTLEDDSLIWN